VRPAPFTLTAQENRMQRPRSPYAVVATLGLLALCDAFALEQAPAPTPAPVPIIAINRPIPLVQGTQVGRPMFSPGDTAKGGIGQPVDGIEGSSREMLKTHIHAHLSLFYKGEQIAIPAGIGIVPPFHARDGFVGDGQGFYWLHTHDATGIIHIESPDDRAYTLGNFFHIWGQPLSNSDVAGLKGPVHAEIDGKPYHGKLGEIVLKGHQQITLMVGKAVPRVPRYGFPAGI
jgi:hypothetical protein